MLSLEKLIVNPCISWKLRVSYEYEVRHVEQEELANRGCKEADTGTSSGAYELFRKDITELLCDQTAIDGWIEFATRKEVRKAELDVNEDFSALLIQREFYAFPSHLLKNFTLGLLTNLRLSYISVTGEVLKYLLSHVPFLRVLRVRWVNLLSLKCDGPNIGIPFKDVPRLVEVSFGRKFCLHAVKFLRRFSSYFMQLERLSLFLKPAPFSLDIPELGNLKYLELKVSLYNRQSLLACIPLLDASPLLQEFILKVVELVGRVASAAVEFVTFVLEKLIVNPCLSWSVLVSYEYEVMHVEEEEIAKEYARTLAEELPPGVEFVIR
ncbi:hypothetical protein Vadar_030003 [Vaccinium darrowii]|uniref:Uncharacterized protein n=1 Tax=Vaccinium darrowii TaxID=229202 RepID=A0ACB7Y2J9_9ERIC|nr:hypothetical protein Vadar_030003 [Vaccinium darrowii]